MKHPRDFFKPLKFFCFGLKTCRHAAHELSAVSIRFDFIAGQHPPQYAGGVC